MDALPAPPPGEGWLYAWAWEDETAGRIRARGFPRRPDGVIAEDEATGSAAILLTAQLNRALNITQGAGSQILTAPGPDGTVEIGGRVRFAKLRRRELSRYAPAIEYVCAGGGMPAGGSMAV